MRFRLILNLLAIVSIFIAAWFFNMWKTEKQRNDTLENNFAALATELKAENYNHNLVMDLTVKDLKKNFPEIVKKIETDFDVKLKNAFQYSIINAEVNHAFKAPVISETWWKGLNKSADSLINSINARNNGILIDTIKLKTFSFKDKWLDFNAIELNDTAYVDRNKIPVPLDQLVFKDKWKLKNLFKKRPLLQKVKSDNPYAEITISRVIQISK